MAIDAVLMGAIKSNASSTITSDAATTANGTSKFAVAVSWDAGVTITGGVPSDNKGNTWVAVGAERSVNGGKQRWFITTTKLGGSGHTITVAFSGTAYPTITALEITSADAVDIATDYEDTGGMPMTMSSGTFAAQPQVLLMLATNYTGTDGAYTVNATTPTGTLVSSQSDLTNYWAHGVAKYAITSTTAFSPSMNRANSGGGSSGISLLSIREAAGGGTTYNQSVSGSVTGSGALAKQTGKHPAGSLTGTGALVRQAAKRVLGSVTGTGAVSKASTRSLAGSITAVGSLATATVLHVLVGGTITAVGALSRMTLKGVAGALTAVGNLATSLIAVLPHGKAVDFVGAGGSSITTSSFNSSNPCAVVAAVGRGDILDHSAVSDNKSGSYSQIGTAHNYTDWVNSGIAVYGAVGVAGGSGHTVTAAKPDVNDEVTLLAVAVPSGTAILGHTWVEDLTDPNTGSITVDGPCTLISFWGGDDASGELNPAVDGNWTKLDWTSSLASNHVQMASAYRVVGAAGTYTVTWTPSTSQGAQVWIVAVATGSAFTKALAGVITMVGSLQRRVTMLQGLAGSITAAGVLNRMAQKTLSGSLTPQGALSRMTAKLVSGSITPTGSLSKLTARALSGSITMVGSLARGWRTFKSLAGSITPTGALASVLNPVIEAAAYWLGKLVLNSRRRRKR